MSDMDVRTGVDVLNNNGTYACHVLRWIPRRTCRRWHLWVVTFTIGCLLAGMAVGSRVAQAETTRGPRNGSPKLPVVVKSKKGKPTGPPAAPPGGRQGSSKTAVRGDSATDATGAPTKSVPETVAVVNGQPITREQLARECLARHGEELLETEVNKQLILQACAKRGVAISAQDVEAEIEQMASKFGFSVERWLQLLRDERDIQPHQYRQDIVWPTLALRKLAAEDLVATSEEMAKAIETEYGAKVKVRMIACQHAQKAEQIRAQAAAKPADFPRLAKDTSEDVNSAAAQGLIPPIRRHVGDPTIEKTVFAMKPGEISPVVSAGGQFLVFKCEQHLPAVELTPAERIEVERRLEGQVREHKMRSAATKLFAHLQKNAKIVNVYNDPQRRAAHPVVAATVNDHVITLKQLAHKCLERHGAAVLDGEINRMLLQQALADRKLNISDQDIEAEIRRAAEAMGYTDARGQIDRDKWLTDVTKEEETTVEMYMRDVVWPSAALKMLAGNNMEITDDDLKKGFESNYGERVRVLAIVTGNQRSAHEVWDMARKTPTDEFFGQLASEYSIEPISKANQGQIPPIRMYGGQPVIEKEAFELKPGNELSGVIALGNRYIILRYLGRTKPVVSEMDSVREELTKAIQEKKLRGSMADSFEQLRRRAQIDNFLAGTTQAPARPEATQASHQEPTAAPRAAQTGSRQQPSAPSTRSRPAPQLDEVLPVAPRPPVRR